MSRLRDKKLNTLHEIRSKEIATAVVKAAIPKFVQRETWLRQPTFNQDGSINQPGAVWPTNDTWPQPNDLFTIGSDDFRYFQIMRVGGYLDGNVSADMIQAPAFLDLRDLYIRLHNLRLQFDVLNPGVETQSLDLHVWRVAYNKHLIATDNTAAQTQSLRENPVPQRGWLRPLTTYNTITGETVAKYNDAITGLKIGVTKVCGGRYYCKPGKMMDHPLGQILPPNATPNQVATFIAQSNARVNQAVYKRIRIQKSWKGLGKKEMFENEPVQAPPPAEFTRLGVKGALSHCRYFLTLRASGTLHLRGVSAIRFSRSDC